MGAHRLAFIQCVGSRDIRFNKYCSGFCCMHAIKEAIIGLEHDREAEVYIFGMDIRAVGKNFEEYRNRGATRPASSSSEAGSPRSSRTRITTPILVYEDTKERQVRQLPVDLVILATACQPSEGVAKLAGTLGIEMNDFGFIETASYLPLDTSRPGSLRLRLCAKAPWIFRNRLLKPAVPLRWQPRFWQVLRPNVSPPEGEQVNEW